MRIDYGIPHRPVIDDMLLTLFFGFNSCEEKRKKKKKSFRFTFTIESQSTVYTVVMHKISRGFFVSLAQSASCIFFIKVTFYHDAANGNAETFYHLRHHQPSGHHSLLLKTIHTFKFENARI